MKTKLALASLLACAVCLPALAESTAFTYQGRLSEGATPAGGLYDLRFSIYDSSVAGAIVAGPVTNSATGVTNGLFAVSLDFGGAAFNGADRWLQIDVRTNGPSAFLPLASRQQITPTPYAIHAAEAANLTNGAIRNPTFVGTTTGAPLTLFANNQAALRLQSSSGGTPNLIGGSSVNSIDPSVSGSTIAGGGEPGFQNSIAAGASFIGSGTSNSILAGAPFSVIGGGRGHTIGTGAQDSIIGGGYFNSILSGTQVGVIAGGAQNLLSGSAGTIGGGVQNTIQAGALYGTISGGRGHFIGTNAPDSTIAGGYYNTIEANAYDGAIGGGANNTIQATANYGTIGGGLKNTNAGFVAVISGGAENTIQAPAQFGAIGGGTLNTNAGYAAVISGGRGHRIGAGAQDSTIAGGYYNSIGAGTQVGVISGGAQNVLTATAGVIGGGVQNTIQAAASYATIGGGNLNAVSGDNSVIAGGQYNTNSASSAFIGAGSNNVIQAGADFAMIGSGEGNIALRPHATIGGGYFNVASGNYNGSGDSGTVAGGWQNAAHGNNATVGGGLQNTCLGNNAAIGGGQLNTIQSNALACAIGGGLLNSIRTNASFATIPGGRANVAGGQYSFAAGRRAMATHDGAFVWADSNALDFPSTTNNEFSVRAIGGTRFVSAVDGSGNPTAGVQLASGGTSWTTLSDRNAKKDFRPVDYEVLLERLSTVPIEQWRYTWEADDSTPNLGPLAQDFKRAFYPGRNDKGITTLEFDGVELAAIQGLNQKLNRKDAEIQQLKQQNDALTKRLNDLEAAVRSLVARD